MPLYIHLWPLDVSNSLASERKIDINGNKEKDIVNK